jgi:hypothetical protein
VSTVIPPGDVPTSSAGRDHVSIQPAPRCRVFLYID